MSEIKLHKDDIGLSFAYLHAHGVSKETTKKWLSRKSVTPVTIDNKSYFLYSTIPPLSKQKLPEKEYIKGDISLEKYNNRIEWIAEALEYHKNDGFYKHYNYINDKYTLSKERCQEFAKKWATWEYILTNYSRSALDLKYLVLAYKKVFKDHLKDEYSFCNFRKKCQVNGIEDTVIDGRVLRKTESRISTFQKELLQKLYIQPQKIVTRAAHNKLIEACVANGEKPYSLASVKLYFKQFESNAELFAYRYGEGAAQKQLPYASLLPAQHRNTQWQIDGWTLPFWGDKFQRYVLYMIRDNHSRKIVGYSIGESENTTLILNALEDAMRNTGVFPGELVSDKHSFHKTEVAARLRAETERMGTVWTVTINAQRNQLAERYNQYIDAICKNYEGYLGKNMTAKGKDARPSPEALAQMAKPANWKTAKEIEDIAHYAVLDFNRTKLDVLDGLSPNEKYAASEDKKAFAISESERVRLLRPVSAYKIIRGQIIIKIGMRKHEYQLPANLIDLYNGQKVEVAYEDLEQGIYISDLSTGEALGFVQPKRKIHGAIPDQTDADRKLLNQQTGRTNGTKVKARKAAQQTTSAALAEHPEAIDLINTYALPKDIRAQATQDAEFKRHLADQGANTNMLPIRTPTVVSLPDVTAIRSRTKESPFANPDVKPRHYTFAELYPERLEE